MTQPLVLMTDHTETGNFSRCPEHYPARPRRVAVIETHFAWVFLAGSLAYKLKKPVLQDCMDYRSLAARQQGFHASTELAATLSRATPPPHPAGPPRTVRRGPWFG
jgi:aminoglycoside phosphotransferase family enzyme